MSSLDQGSQTGLEAAACIRLISPGLTFFIHVQAHLALSCFTDVAFFYKWKARPYIHCNTHCIAVIGNEPTVSLKSASREVKVFTSSGCCKMDIGS